MNHKATYSCTYYENGIKYCDFKYRDETYTVCYNIFHCWKNPVEQHREAQAEIDERCRLRTLLGCDRNAEEGLDLFFSRYEE